MEIGVGLDSRLGLGARQLLELGSLAKDLGYGSLWTNAGVDYDPIGMCIAWNQRTGLPTGVSVVPVTRNPAAVLALAARTAHELSFGHFVLGIGSGSVTDRPIKAVRDCIAEVQRTAPGLQLVVGALGPQMLKVAATHAQGAALNWCTPAQVAWSRTQTGPQARLLEYLRVAVDDDVAAARRALARQILAYALLVRPSGARGYRAHFERMGFAPELAELEARKAGGASDEELAASMPERLLRSFGYAGTGLGARDWLDRAAAGLDVAIVRVLNPRTGDAGPVRRAIEAFAPARPGPAAGTGRTTPSL